MYTGCYAPGHLKCSDQSSSYPVRILLILVYVNVISLPLWATGFLNMLVGSLALKGHLC